MMLQGVVRKPRQLIRRLLLPRGAASEVDAPVAKQWSIGIYAGPSPLNLAPHREIQNPVLTAADVSDVPAATVADPFMLKVAQTWHMFFEVMNQRTAKGQIGWAVSQDALRWTYRGIVLAEPFHLSYPYVFEHDHNFYMIPESHEAGSVRLYQATEFPARWTWIATLLEGGYFVDSSVFRHDGAWWLFVDTSQKFGDEYKHDTLSLFSADRLEGPWRPHPQSPLIVGNARIARPGGRVVTVQEKIIRYGQDCYPVYGTQLRAFQVTELTLKTYRERPVSRRPTLKGSGRGWNSAGMHHCDPHPSPGGRWVACVDGFGVAAKGSKVDRSTENPDGQASEGRDA